MIDKLDCGFLVLNYACNNRCKWCYAAPAEFKPDYMPLENAKRFLKLMQSLGINDIGIIGGEPTLHKQLPEIICFAKKLGFAVTLYSNGRLLSNKEFAQKIKTVGTDFVNISIQSLDKKNHDKQCNAKGAFEETVKGIENCFKQGFAVNLETVLSHTNFEIYKELMEAFPQANSFIFFREAPLVTNLKEKYLSNKETHEVARKIFSFAKQKGIRAHFFARMPACWFEQDELDKEIQEKIVSHCHILNGKNLIIDVNGNTLPCAHWISMPSMSLIQKGKIISKKKFLKEWNFGKPAEIRRQLTKYPDKKCADCEHWGKKCTGGCPLTKFELPKS